MLFKYITAAAALFTLASSRAVSLPKLDERDQCIAISNGEIIMVTVKIVEHPVIFNRYVPSNTIIIQEDITIEVTNAPTYLVSTVTATSTSTVTELTTTTATAQITVQASSSAAAATTAQGSAQTTATVKYNTVPVASGPVAGGSAVGQGLNTALFTATTTYSKAVAQSTAVTTYTYSNASTTYKATSTSTSNSTAATATSISSGDYTDWTVFKANGVNLGGWFEIETSNDPEMFLYAPNATDEWTWCKTLGSRCGPLLEERYATFITTDFIDKLAGVGVNFLRIPMTYAAWVLVPGSELYHGNQQTYLQTITKYAIETYGMRVAIGLHSLPGGVNSLDIGEAIGHDNWFYNNTNLEYSYQAIEAILTFIENSGNPWAFSVSALNEASDNLAGFATATTLTSDGTAWIVEYIQGVINRTEAVNSRIPVVLQDCFLGEEHWSGYFANTTNLVIDTHIYYFAASGVYSGYVTPAICGQAKVAGGDGKFPVYIGEWALQVLYNNTYDNRETIFNTQRYAWSEYVSGGSFWSAKFNGTAAVDGEGTQKDYWNYNGLIDAGVINPIVSGATYC